MNRRIGIALGCVFAFVTLVYANHFGNAFHFDDFHTIVQNPYIQNIRNIPRFFTEIETTSVLPANRTWRPLVFSSIALDYWLGGGMQKMFYFHLSTFLWFLIQLGLMFALFRKILDLTLPNANNVWVALFAAAVYGVHPAIAETVNYINQRADLYSTLGVIAGIVAWAWFPAHRKYGLYLLPVAAAILSKAPAVVFPGLLFLYIWLVEERDVKSAARLAVPSLIAVGALAWVSSTMVPASFTPGARSAYAYRITQPVVIFRYFRTFFIPTGLTADTDRAAFNSIFEDAAPLGFLFLVGLIALAAWAKRKRETRPIAFGLFWFLLAATPTAVFPLAEVENDHRMFFPFVGLALSVSWAAALWLYRRPAEWKLAPVVCGAVLLAFGWGTWERNKVWKTEDSLWYDVTLKSPKNGRGLMNYGLTLMQKGEIARSLDYFERADVYNPNYYVLEVNLGVANGALRNEAAAEQHFIRANQLAPNEAVPHYYYAVWLRGKGRVAEAIQNLKTAIANNPQYLDASHLLMDIYGQQQDSAMLREAAAATLARFPGDPVATSWLGRAANLAPTAETYLNQSLVFYQQGKFDDSIKAAREALKLRPNYSEAWNNIAAAYNSLGLWDQGISAGQEAVRLSPGNQLAKNNLAWAIQQKQKAAGKGRGI